jgi:lantibiotic modifying enzyme
MKLVVIFKKRAARSVPPFLILSLLPLLFYSQTAVAQSVRPAQLLNAAKEAGLWLDSLAVKNPASGAIRWPISLESPNSFLTGLDRGAAGIGMFYLRLWDVTGDPHYLEQALGAAIFIDERYSRGDFFGPDWLAGAASGGTFALELFRRTGDRSHLNLAKKAASFLINTANTDQPGFYWDHGPATSNRYVGMPHGAAGIGKFLIDLYTHTNDPELLRYAEGAYTWADQYSVQLPSGAKGFKRLTTDGEVYVLWSGSTGMIIFQNALWKATGDRRYLDELERTAESLLEHAVQRGNGLTWPYNPGGRSFPTVYFHGASSTIEALLIAYETTGRKEFRAAAKKGAQWLINIKLSAGGKTYFWPHIFGWAQFDTGLGIGTASVGAAFVRLYKTAPGRVFLEYAKGTARYLLRISNRDVAGQRYWVNYTNQENLDYAPRQHSTGWSDGASGIGIFLLDLYEVSIRKNGKK